MPINIRQPDLSGLNYVAGKSGAINVSPPGALGLQAYQEQTNARNAIMRNNTEMAQIQQQGQLALGQQDIQRQQMAVQQAAMQQQAQQQQQGLFQQAQPQTQQISPDLVLRQQQQAFNQQQAQQATDRQNYKEHMDEINKLNDKQIQDRGGFASYALMSMQSAKSPDDAQQYWNAISKEAVDKKYLSSDQAAQLGQLPLSQRINALKGMVISLGATKEYKDMNPPDKSTAATKGAPVTNPDGSVSVPLTAAEQTATQKQVAIQDKMLNQLAELKQTFKPDYFTYGGKGTKWLAEQESKLGGSPLQGAVSSVANVLTGQTPDQRQQFLSDAAQYNHSAGQIFQQYIQSIAGSRPSAERVKQLETLFANGQMSPTEYQAGLEQLIRDIMNERNQAASMLKTGMNVTPPADPNAGKRAYMLSLKNPDGSPRFTPEGVEAYLKQTYH